MEKLICEVQPKYWLHGHTHSRVVEMLGETVVMANPRGYKDCVRSDWNTKVICC
jgi:Icc-related predicted phosphoesterase